MVQRKNGHIKYEDKIVEWKMKDVTHFKFFSHLDEALK